MTEVAKFHKILIQFIRFRVLLLSVIVFCIYLIAGKIGLGFAIIHSSATTLWPPTGLALAVMLIFGNKLIPAIFLGAFFVNLTTSGNVPTSLGIALGNTLEAITAAYFIQRYAKGTYVFNKVVDILKFTFLAGILSTLVSSTIGVITLILGDLTTWDKFWSVWLTWWLGDMGGALVFAPLILVWVNNLSLDFSLKKILHLLGSFVVLLIVTTAVFSGTLPYPYLTIPVAVWIAFWFGQRGTVISTVLVATISIYYTLSGRGPFVDQATTNQSLLLLQMFLNIFSLTGLTFASVLSEMKDSQRKLEYNERRFQGLIEHSYDGVVLIDTTSRILYASPSVKHILGYEPEEMIGMVGFDLVAPEDRQLTMEKLAELVTRPGGRAFVEYRTIKKDGSLIWVEAAGTNLLLEPAVHAVVVNYHDITKQKAAQEKLVEEKMEDEAMLSSIGEGIIATNEKGEITMVNEATCQILGWEEDEMLGKKIAEIIPMEDSKGRRILESERPINEVLANRKKHSSPSFNWYIKKDKTKLPVKLNLSPIILNGKIVGAIEVFHDFSKDLELERSKDEFISVASHELRTPITAINGLLSMIINGDYGPVNDNLKKPLENTYISAKRQIALINDLLDVSRLQTGRINFKLTDFSIGSEIDEVIKSLLPIAVQKGISLECVECPTMTVQADKEWFKHIMNNLIGNALKFTEKGGVSISYFQKDDLAHINIIDTGVGIDPKDFDKLFKQFQQLRNENKLDKPMGSGLGLYLSRQVAQTMGGEVILKKSDVGKGSIFTYTLPVADTPLAKRVKKSLEEKINIPLSNLPLIS